MENPKSSFCNLEVRPVVNTFVETAIISRMEDYFDEVINASIHREIRNLPRASSELCHNICPDVKRSKWHSGNS